MWQEGSTIISTRCGPSVATLGLFVSLNISKSSNLFLVVVRRLEIQGLTGEEEFWPQVD